MNRLKIYEKNIINYDNIFKDHYINIMQLPKINKITLNIGLGLKAILDKKQILTSLLSLKLITEQYSIITKSKKSIDKFKLRENMPIGNKVTLKKNNIYKFMDNLINIIMPNIDNSNDIYNSKYFKLFKIEQNKLYELNNINILKNLLLNNDKYINKNINKFNKLKIYWKYNKNNMCVHNKLWYNKNNKNNYIPKGLNYINYNLNKYEIIFFNQHYFIITSNIIFKYNKKNKKLLNNYTINIGLKNFISLFNNVFNYGQLESIYGTDIVFVINYINNNYLKKPNYLLSSYQLPL